MKTTEKLEANLDSELVKAARAVAEATGVDLDSVIEQALRELVERGSQGAPDDEVMRYYRESVARYRTVYERLAK